MDFVILAICGLDLGEGATPPEAKVRRYYTAPNRIGNKEAKVLGIARGIDNPGSVLVFLGHFPTVFGGGGVVLVALKGCSWRGRPGWGRFIASGPAGFGAPVVDGVL